MAAAAPQKTRDRILGISLEMFNAQGEPNVTTNHIADELEISPGNLYYHFRNKDDIVEHLFALFETRMDKALTAPDSRLANLEDLWLQMHLVFECIWDYRFVLKRGHENIGSVCKGLVESGVMLASPNEIDAVGQHILLAATFWLNFQHIRPAISTAKTEQADLGRGAYLVMMLLAPYLRPAERAHLNKLAEQYVS
jgi:AcrR family transcriptional regulator